MSDVALPKSVLHKFLQGQGMSFDFHRYLFLIQRRLWLLLIIVCLAMVGTFAWLSRQPKIYASRAVVQVEQEEAKVLGSKVEDIQSAKLTAEDYLQTIVQSLTSNSVMIGVAQLLGLDKDPELFPGAQNGKVYPEAAVASRIRQKVHVSLRRDTRLIDIVAEDTKAERARDVAGAVFQSYLRQSF